jgi:hypothetical protein
MSARDTLAALIERVEKATGPDRELDAEVGALVLKNGCIRETEGRRFQIQPHPRRYTASIDAAVSLVSDWVIASLGDLVADGLPGAVLLVDTDPVKHTTGVGYGARESGCLARALVAAALRARMESER